MKEETEVFDNEIIRYFEDGGDSSLRYNYDLNKESVVFDIGGYVGDFAELINSKFGSRIFVFEPTTQYYRHCLKKFKNKKNVKILHYGIGGFDGECEIFINGDATSTNLESDDVEKIEIKKLDSSMNDLEINHIDLMKINIEGDEYPLLEKALESGILNNVSNIQVQYHLTVENCVERRNKITKELEKTHKLEWKYDWVWESWKIK
jgi:FkbM family methyltransferase